jgi:hypothetical protein
MGDAHAFGKIAHRGRVEQSHRDILGSQQSISLFFISAASFQGH